MGKVGKNDEEHRPRGRPPLRATGAKRASFGTRITEELKNRIEAAAAMSGRSTSEEIEYRLDRSFEGEKAEAEKFGGEHLVPVFQMLGAAARLVEQKAGKTAQEDWDTNLAVLEACKKLLPVALGTIRPEPPEEWKDLIAADIPPPARYPERPMGLGGLLSDPDPQAQEEHAKAVAAFEEHERQRREEADAYSSRVEKALGRIRDLAAVGLDIAPRKPQR